MNEKNPEDEVARTLEKARFIVLIEETRRPQESDAKKDAKDRFQGTIRLINDPMPRSAQ